MIMKYIFRCLVSICCTLYFSTYAEEYTDITKTKQYKEYEAFARKLKKETDNRLEFNKDDITENKTDINAILNTSIPNWQSLNTNKKQQSQGVTNNENQDIGSVPLVFISFSMPEALIEDYIDEARIYGGVLVFRGLINNSFKQTVTKLKEIEGNNGKKSNISITIHPHLFKLYDVKQVPAIVVSKDNLSCILKYDDCSALYEYDKISGSVTIGYALEEFEKNGSSLGLRRVAKEILDNKKGL
jgi:type-F conjugative transfer system pilin assembly protein TrbC